MHLVIEEVWLMVKYINHYLEMQWTKKQIVNLFVNVSKDLNGNDEVILKIKDIMNNQYDYKVDIKYKDEKIL